MSVQAYECLFILDSNHYARDAQGLGQQISNLIEGAGGEVLVSRLWTEQKLAYPIDGHKKGTYWLTYFHLESTKLGQFKRACALNESIVRSLTLKLDPRLVDVLVAHARGERLPEELEGGEEEGAEPAAVGEEA